MINLLSKINIIDNSGAKEGIMIKRLVPKVSSRPQKGFAKVGNIISLSVRKTIPNSTSGHTSSRSAGGTARVKRKNVYQGIVVRTKKINNIIQKKEYARAPSLVGSSVRSSASGDLISDYTFKLKHPLHFKNNFSSQKLGGHTVTWQDNSVVLVSRGSPRGGEFQPIGTRIKGPICQSLKLQKGCLKIVSISNIH